MKEYTDSLRSGLTAMGIALSEAQCEKLLDFGALLLAENERQNLTAVREPREVVSRHFLDSLAPLAFPEFSNRLSVPGARLIDVGTGAGFPGIPLAIALPELSCTLLDSLQKRIAFLEDAVNKLNLPNVTLLSGRAEDLAKDAQYRETFDLATSRAVADLSVLLEYDLPFVRVGGAFLAYKGPDIAGELEGAANALQILGGTASAPTSFAVPGLDGERTLLLIEKTALSPEKYPRRAGIPTKRPL